MRQIRIESRLRPFATTPKTWCLIPYSPYAALVYPTLIEVYHLGSVVPQLTYSYALPIPKRFMVTQNWERGVVTLWHDDRYHLLEDGSLVQQKKPPLRKHIGTRLSLGSHKQLFWEKCTLRFDPSLILPLLVVAGEQISDGNGRGGIFDLLDALEEKIHQRERETILPLLEMIYRGGLHGMLVPRLIDDHHQGICTLGEGNPLAILARLRRLILSCIVQDNLDEVALLPSLPNKLHAGKLLHTTEHLEIHCEWSKHRIKRIMIGVPYSRNVKIVVDPSIKSFRLSTSPSCYTMQKNGSTIACEPGVCYSMDRFIQ